MDIRGLTMAMIGSNSPDRVTKGLIGANCCIWIGGEALYLIVLSKITRGALSSELGYAVVMDALNAVAALLAGICLLWTVVLVRRRQSWKGMSVVLSTALANVENLKTIAGGLVAAYW